MRQDDLEFHFMSACRYHPISIFVDAGGSLRACGVELQRRAGTKGFLNGCDAALAGSLGFGSDWGVGSDSAHLRKEEPTLVPMADGIRMRSVAIGAAHVLALTDEGQVYTWGTKTSAQARRVYRAPKIPTLLQELVELKIIRVSAGTYHCAVLTDDGKLWTWYDFGLSDDADLGTGFPLPDLEDGDDYTTFGHRARCVEALAAMRIISVAAGSMFTIVATDEGALARPHILVPTP
jgi:hypothetical protein